MGLKGGRRLTKNRMGWAARELGEVSLAFVEFARDCKLPVLDVGTGFGLAAEAAWRAGAPVIANDLDGDHLEELAMRCANGQRLTLRAGEFPRDLHFEEGVLGAVHAAAVFHFLNGRKLEHGFRAIGRWLAPGGRLFVEAATPFQAPFAGFLEEYERRVKEGARWPGWVVKIGAYSKHRHLGLMPPSLHLLDDLVLRRLCEEEAGLRVDQAWLHRRRDLSVTLELDGRETVGLIASKV
jgi:SAM-dependent methyltransferase